jgi:hypothetical protein
MSELSITAWLSGAITMDLKSAASLVAISAFRGETWIVET